MLIRCPYCKTKMYTSVLYRFSIEGYDDRFVSCVGCGKDIAVSMFDDPKVEL